MFLPVTEVFFNTLKLVVSHYKIFWLIITWDQRGISTGAKGTRWIPTVTSLNHPVHVWRVYADIEIYVVELCDMWASCSAPLSIHLELPFPCIVSAPSSSLAAVPYSLLHLIILRLNVSLLFVALLLLVFCPSVAQCRFLSPPRPFLSTSFLSPLSPLLLISRGLVSSV